MIGLVAAVFSDMTCPLSFACTEGELPKPVVPMRPSAARAAPDPLSMWRRESRFALFMSVAPLCIHLGDWAAGRYRKPVQLKTAYSSGRFARETTAKS